MSGLEKRSQDISHRFKRTRRTSTKTTKQAASSVISSPPKAATSKRKTTEDLVRRHRSTYERPVTSPGKQGERQTPGTHTPADSPKSHTSGGASEEEPQKDGTSSNSNFGKLDMTQDISTLDPKENDPFYQAPSSSAKQPVTEAVDEVALRPKSRDKEDEHRRSWSGKHELLEQISIFKDKLDDLRSELVENDDIWKAQLERERIERTRERNRLAEMLHAAEKEAMDRQQQLLDLKQSLSAFTHVENQVSDNLLAENMDHLFHRIREWTLSNFRKCRLNLDALDQSSIAQSFSGKTLSSITRLGICQAIVVKEMMNIFHDQLFFGLPHDGPLGHVREIAQYFQHHQAKLYNQWREATMNTLLGIQDTQLAESTNISLQEIVTRSEDILCRVTGLSAGSARRDSLKQIFEAAVSLSRLLQVQRPQYAIEFPCSGSNLINPVEYRMDMMEIQNADEDDTEVISSVLVIFPSLIKRQTHPPGTPVRTCIYKAKVIFTDS